MARRPSTIISAAVEGDVDEAVVDRLAHHVGLDVYQVYGKRGKAALRQNIGGYNNAARHQPWLVLIDLDDEAECAPPLLPRWLSNPAPLMRFRIAVREVEAWLLGDRERIASHLRVPVTRVPVAPELESDPKATIVNIARRSRRRSVRENIVPRPGSGRQVGIRYTSTMIEFILAKNDGWRPDVAAKNCPSLAKCIRALDALGE